MVLKIYNSVKQAFKNNQQPALITDPFFGIKAGTGTRMGPPLRIEGSQYIHMGNDCHIGTGCWLGAYDSYPFSTQRFTPQITIGNNVFVGDHSIITSVNKIIIEDGVELSHYVYISDHVHSNTPEENVPLTKRRLVSRGYVKIGAYTGVGIRSVISQGVTLGKYCFVTPNSVVTRSFPDYSMIRGNPAILIKTFSKQFNKWVEPDEEMKKKYNRET
jgi:acetyltransferase-like isoleucine patch superfamily enzyme